MRRAVLVVATLALTAPSGAAAHASLSTASPGFRERLESPPASVVLRFSQVVSALPDGVVVRDDTGRVVSEPARLGGDRRSLAARLRPLARGAYAVRWQTLSVSDGHVISGLYTFGVGVPAPPPTEAIGASGPSTVEKLVRWLSYLGLAALAGGLALRLVAFPRVLPERLDQAFFGLVAAAALVTVDAGIAGLLLRADAALQLPFDRFLYADLSPFAGGTRLGIAWAWMTLGCALIAALLTVAWLRRSTPLLWPALAVALALTSGFSLSGHTASQPNSSTVAIVVDWLHIAGASVWIGGLLTLGVIGWRLDPRARRTAFLRFSAMATGLVGLVVVAGIYLSLLRLSAPSELWTTPYGRVLLAKLALVALALAWGAAHRFLVRPRLMRGSALPGGRVGRSLMGESLVGMAVLLVAAMLANTAPPDGGRPAGASAALESPGR
mgnify:CR=1 FL=1